jgi:hypothetical protein
LNQATKIFPLPRLEHSKPAVVKPMLRKEEEDMLKALAKIFVKSIVEFDAHKN